MLLGAYTYAILTVPMAAKDQVYYLYGGSAVKFSLVDMFQSFLGSAGFGGGLALVLAVLVGLILAGLAATKHWKIWLDDMREAPEGYCHCHSGNEAKKKIMECEREYAVIDVIDCDHDLGDYASDGGDGIKLIDWLAERKTFYPIILHTMNPVGRDNMLREIERYWDEK